MSARTYQGLRDRRLRRRRLGRRRRSHRPRAGAGRVLGRRARTGTAASPRGLQARRAEVLVSRAASPTTRSRIRRRSASDPAEKAELQKFRPALWYGRGVGGASLHFTANYWRFHEIDFNERSVLGAIAGTGFADWPITYADLEPYYTKVEWEIGVSGLAGASPFDPPRTKPYPMPPLPVKSSGVLFERGARKLGLHPVPGADGDQLAAVSRPRRRACIAASATASPARSARRRRTLTTVIPEAEATGPLRGAARKLRVRGSRPTTHGRATGVTYFDRDRRERFSARARRWWYAPTAPRRRGCC